MEIVNVCGHSLAKNLLGPKVLVLDCGANYGSFSKWVSENCNAIVHGFEPDPRLFPNLPQLPQVNFYPLAVSGSGEPLTLMLGDTRCSTTCFTEKTDQASVIVESVRLEQFCQANSILNIDMLKLDIEGAEIGVLASLSKEFLENIGQITVEFHDFIQKDQVPHIKVAISKLKKYGFFCIIFSHHDYADVLCINMKKHHVSLVDMAILYTKKYLRGFSRIMRRKFGAGTVKDI